MNVSQAPAGAAVPGNRSNLGVWMAEEEPENLSAGVSAGARDRHSDRHTHNYTW
jgi:hypothetical protein